MIPHKNIGQFQFIWWGWKESIFFSYIVPVEFGNGRVYKWLMHFGPLEIRRWR